MILTKPENLKTRGTVVATTWAKECTEYKFITTIPHEFESNKNTVRIEGSLETVNGLKLLQPTGFISESYEKLTAKVYLAFIEISRRYADFDFYLKADDDTFIFMEHLKRFLADKKPCEAVSYGFNIKYWFSIRAWQSGGAGYVLTQRSMHTLGIELARDIGRFPDTGVEDEDVAKSLNMVGTFPGNSRDDLGRERFHP
jgi:glycoprotein-N-acetylgalactosamine 3-beta-galactosyltransferase